MRQLDRPVVAGLVLVSGLALLPFVSLHGEEYRWQTYGGVYQADLQIEKTSSPPVPLGVGQQFPYTVTVRNLGPADATNVVVDDSLDDRTSYVSDTCGGSYNGGTNTWTWMVGSLLANAQASCNVTVSVDAVGSLVNTAMVSGEQPDPVLANDSATAVDVVTGASIPSLTRPALVVLLMLLGGISLALMRRQ
jgi:uncharacterized repeat protein (TIGR01451 family)